MKAIILAAGYGDRLRPLTNHRPKVMIPIVNIPILENTIAFLSKNNIRNIMINTHYLPDNIIKYFGDGSDRGVRIRYSHENEILGTAGGIKMVEDFLRDGTFLVINGDILIDLDLKEVIGFHQLKRSFITMVLREDEKADEYGPISINREGKICRFLGKPEGPCNDNLIKTMFTGVHIMEPGILNEIPHGRYCGTTDEVYPHLLEKGLPVYGYITSDYWKDIGTHHRYMEAHKDILNGKFDMYIKPKRQKKRDTEKIRATKIIPPVMIGDNPSIGEGVVIGPYTVIGRNCILEKGTTIEESILWDDISIGSNVKISNSIIGSGVQIPDLSSLYNEVIT